MVISPPPIHIAYCFDNSYAPYAMVAIKSIGENHHSGEVYIHVLVDVISNRNLKRLTELVDEYRNMHLHIYKVDIRCLSVLKVVKDRWPISTWFRILLPSILPDKIDKVLYLDADTLVVSDLQELFAIDMTDYSIAAVLDPMSFKEDTFERCEFDKHKQYICDGVLLMNLDYWRKHNLKDRIIEWSLLHTEQLKFPDQDAINYICHDSKIVLPFRFGILNYFGYERFYKSPYIEQLKECIEKPIIIHYADHYPWLKDGLQHPFCDMWMVYNKMLKSPIRRRYKTKGKLLIKLIIWDVLHPFKSRPKLTLSDIRYRISNKFAIRENV